MLNRTRSKAENLLDRFSPTPYSSAPLPPRGKAAKQYGEVSEWLKEHAWKVCIRQRIEGSNPSLTAIFEMRARTKVRAFFFYILPRGRDENPRPRIRQLAIASWTDRERSEWAARRASAASQSLPEPIQHRAACMSGGANAYPTYKIPTPL